MDAAASPLPGLRDELSLHPGPALWDGSPTWTIRDPVRNRYFRIGWAAFEALSRWEGTAGEVAAAVRAETTIDMSDAEVMEVARFLSGNQLTQASSHADTVRLTAQATAENHSVFNRLLHHYLFFRIPLLRPDRFLGKVLPLVAWLGSPWFRWASLGALLLGLTLVARQWELFAATLVETFSISGMVSYGLALSLVKIIHELAHGLTAKRFGCRVPTMGVAFLVMWPVLYTDVNETWTLASRRQRLLVGAAGIMAELSVAAWATLLWAFLPDGSLRQGAFILAAFTWVSSLAINLLPFMRFDGYFLVMDALELPNLHPRAFAMARWWLRESLFALGEPPPEPMKPGRQRAMVAFAFAVWIYRLMLFLGIAALVYHFFIKIVGILLFAVEIGWFVLLPIWSEVKAWVKRRERIFCGTRWMRPLFGLSLVLWVAIFPWRTRIEAPATVAAEIVAPLFLPAAARLEAVLVKRGQPVHAGMPLLLFTAPDILARQATIAAKLAGKRAEVEAVKLDLFGRERLSALTEELARLDSEKAGLDAEAERLTVTAPHSGLFLDPLPDLQVGAWLSPRQQLALIRADGATIATAYVAEDDLERIHEGDAVRFIPYSLDQASMVGTIHTMDRNPVKVLTDPALATLYGGEIPVRVSGQNLVPQGGFFRIIIHLEGLPPPIKLVGHVQISGQAQSLVGRVLRSALVVLVREWGA
ncbi:peptidase M50 [Magnetococcus marinus MC-1]|uniref:Peptidase M50 n=1 Tax=Magnetococcus marinus (strain ATCC BAA-1437 / JCM 17883 / MC-1) TaxID=156889 RepID=A0L4Q0_MAGMM|nr:site-2 protease family protein [Magnetococcus marinus]ABK42943.1 peptidase M50 [Magnetococcus marinus MC-1]